MTFAACAQANPARYKQESMAANSEETTAALSKMPII